MVHEAQLFIAGSWIEGESTQEIDNKFSGAPTTRVHVASADQVEKALRALSSAFESSTWHPYDRYLVFLRAAELLRERQDSYAPLIVDDSGLTITDVRRELDRTVQTLLLCGEEAKRITGEIVPVTGAPNAALRVAFTVRDPLGVVCAITPFNAPINTVAHKIGPALAAGNSVVIKPAGATPVSAELLVRTLLDAGLPEQLIALVHGPGRTVGQWLLESDIPNFYAFTGSTAVGERVRAHAGLRRVQLELGSLSSTIVCSDADLRKAASLSTNAAFRKAGQVCTSIQRLYVQRSAVQEVAALIADELSGKAAGDPQLDSTFVGPLISRGDAERVEQWISEAVDGGAEVLAGGTRSGQVVAPTVLANVNDSMSVMTREIFGPVVAIRPFDTIDQAITEANATPYGLSAGVFTSDIDTAWRAAQRLRVGSIHINETSSSRLDMMPYGGVKLSGTGKEGPRYAIHEMTEERLITFGPARGK